MKTLNLIVLLSLLTGGVVNAQNQKEHKKGSYVDSLNCYYQHVDLPVYFYVSTSPDEKPIPLKEEHSREIKPMYLDGPGVHHIKHQDAIHKKVDTYLIYGDDKAPNTRLQAITAPTYKDNKGKLFYGKDLTIGLYSKDDMSGVAQTYVSINGAEYTEYSTPLSFSKEGDYTVKYYAVDNVGNVELPQTYNFMVDLTPPKTFHNVVGIASGQVISPATRIYLDKQDNGSGVETSYYLFDNEEPKVLQGRELQFKYLDNGEHTLYYWSIDKVKNTETKQSFSFYLDKIAPIASMDILGDKFLVNDKIYFSGRTKVKLTAIDNRTGIKELKYSINNSVFQNYTEPFYMPDKSGLYVIRFYAIDESDNRNEDEGMHSRGVIYVDLSGPVLDYKLEGPTFKRGENTYIGAKTKLNIIGKDAESGLQYLAYSINKGEEVKYTQSFSIDGAEGEYIISYIGYDNVNNRNQKDVKLMLDTRGPSISFKFSSEPDSVVDGNGIYPSYVKLFLSATDEKTTSSAIYYSINGGSEQTYVTALKDFGLNKDYHIRVRAKDALDNETITEIKFATGNY